MWKSRNGSHRIFVHILRACALFTILFALSFVVGCDESDKEGLTCNSVWFDGQGVHKGDTVTFGNYPQATSTFTPIEWIVLDIDTAKGLVLLLSKYVLDTKPYNTEYAPITWENCSLRNWLNQDFLNTAFSSSQQASISTTHLENPDNLDYGTSGGNATDDKVFLLTIEDVKKHYFRSDAKRKAKATAFAIDNHVWANTDEGTNGSCANIQCSASWWLRSPYYYVSAAKVARSGDIYGDSVENPHIGVRPALWVIYGTTNP